MTDLSGRVTIVTGAASGIGRATALRLASLGATVVATDQNEAGLAEVRDASGGGHLLTRRHDVTSEGDWRDVFLMVERLGRLDVLVNNAGIMLAGGFEETPIDDLRRQYRVNVEGPFLGMRGAISLMKASIAEHQAHPSIVNISSIYGQIAGDRYAAYSASKGAVKMLSKAVAHELAATGIRVNSVHPGPTATNLGANQSPPVDSSGAPLPRNVIVSNWMRRIPLGRFGAADEIAAVVAFLAGDDAAYITGAEIVIDGGYSSI